MGNIIYFSDHLEGFKKIEPLIREICTSAGITDAVTNGVIAEYKVYFDQLSSLPNKNNSAEQLNHACHIILGLLIKARL
jgi:hypothetical protein